MKPLAQQAYEIWVATAVVDVYSDFDTAVYHGYHTWEKLPLKIKKAWEGVVVLMMKTVTERVS